MNKRCPFNFDIENAFKTDKASRDKSLNKSPTDLKMRGRGRGVPAVVSDTLQKLKVVIVGDKRTTYQEGTITDPVESVDMPRLVSIQCLNCKKQAGSFCARCKEPYCSLYCQRQDWSKHKSHCKSVSNTLLKSTQFSNDSSYLSEGSSCSDNDKRTDCDKMSGPLYRNRGNTFHEQESNYVKPQVPVSPKNSPQQKDGTKKNSGDQMKHMKAAEIKKAKLSLNVKQKVTVCNICSPSCFWIHLSDANITLSQMEEELAKIQKIPVKSITVDDICCVKKNGKFYRAKILELQSNSLVLYFIDYGETSTVRNDEMYHLPCLFKKYPAQAVRCNLVVGDNQEVIEWTDEDISSFEFHARNKTFVADVYGFFKNTYNISLMNESGISLHSIMTRSRFTAVNEHPESNGSELSIPSVLSSLKTGAEVAVAAVQFEGDSKFFGLLDDGSGEVQVVIEELEKSLQTVQTKEINLTCEEGDLAAGFSLIYNQYYRCIILKRLRNSFLVRYLDYGNQEEISKLCALTPDLSQKKSYVVCCEKPSSIPSDVFKSIFEKSCVVTVKSVNNETAELSYKYRNDTLIIHCYPWYHGTAIKNHSVQSRETVKVPENIQFSRKRNSFSEKQCISKTNNAVIPKVMKGEVFDKVLSANTIYSIKVAFIKNATEIYIHLISGENALNALSQGLNKLGSAESCAVYSPSVDEIVCCKFSGDGVWYRAQVIGRKGNKSKVHFIDYGNESIVCDSDVKPLPRSFVVPKFAACVSLYNIKNEDISDNLLKKLLEEVWTMKVKNFQKSPVEVMFFKGSKPLTEFLEEKSSNLKGLMKSHKSPTGKAPVVAKSPDKGNKLFAGKDVQGVKSLNLPINSNAKYPTMSTLKTVSLEKGVNEVIFSFVENDMYYCHLKNNATDFAILTEKLLNPDLKPLSQKPVIGDLVCARSEDKSWYRASIQSIDKDSKYKVLFIDYGNCEYVSFDNVKCLPDDLLQYPIFCVPVTVTNIERAINAVNINALLAVKTVGFSDKNVQLVEIVLPKSVNLPKLDSLKKQVLPIDMESEVSICFVENDVIYTHMKSSKELILALESKLINTTQFNSMTSLPEVGDLICAKFIDDIWYRGSVKKVSENDNSCEIHFIDYGNSEIISLENMKVLPNSLCTFPVLSVPLKFRDIEKLQDQITTGKTVFHVKFFEMSSEQIPIVDIVLPEDEKEKFPLIESQTLPESPVQVIVSHIDCDVFYVQKVSDAEKLQELMVNLQQNPDSLKNLPQSPKIGQLLNVKFHDQNFYRGIIKEKISDTQYSVFFVDFGNTDIISAENIKCLPLKYSSLPMLSIAIKFSKAEDALTVKMDSVCTVKYTGIFVNEIYTVKLCPTLTPVVFSSLKVSSLEKGSYDAIFTSSDCSGDRTFHFLNKVTDSIYIEEMNALLEKFDGEKIDHIPVIDEVFVVKCQDKLWRRGSVKSVDETSNICRIYLIDTGVTENILFSDIYHIPESISSFPIFGMKVEVENSFATIDISTGKEYNITVLKKTSDGVPVISVFKRYLVSSLQQKSLPLDELRNVMFSCKENDKLYLQDTSYEAQLLEIQVDLMKQLSSEMISHNPTVGELLCTYNKLNDKWYRCCIVEIISPEKWKVRFVDFGNEEVVSRESLRPFTSKLAMYPIFAIPVRMSGRDFKSSDIELEHLYSVIAETLPENNVQLVKIVLSTSSHTNISPEEISTNVNSTNSSCEQEVSRYFLSSSEYVPFPPGEQDIVIYSVTEECGLFCAPYNQEAIAANLGLSSEITQYCESMECLSYNSAVLPEADQLVLAKYSDDSQWYRAVVLDNSSHPFYEVYFIDYGNVENIYIDSMRRMEKQFMSLNVQAHFCSLTGFDVDDEMLPSVIQELKNFTLFIHPHPLTALVSSVDTEMSVNIPSITKLLMEKNLIAKSQS
ncbi:tudor domain-containing protein 1 [Trichonephila inaurata madagascariensis]|uniref:Tudor domain-containing protein 1 n=1 Tax=Trichonephila inaurata madagascariensis TaxID=2747483 RepID=A0A8X7BRE7_9ARAC|nr:tudor domain-containing protein 1 [Trichonephila inaurata madagascariensis]